ncbi:MAG: hypothetical protein V1754_10995 [Pseudomonadota bacterium]
MALERTACDSIRAMQNRIIQRLIVLALVLGLEMSALAEKVMPLVPKMDPVMAEELVARFHDALAEGLQGGGLDVEASETVRLALKDSLGGAGCAEGSCIAQAQNSTGSNRVGTAEIRVVGKNYTIEVRVFRGEKLEAKVMGRCDICTLREALKSVVDLGKEAGLNVKSVDTAEPRPVLEPEPAEKTQPPESVAPSPKPQTPNLKPQAIPPKPSAAILESPFGEEKNATQKDWKFWTGVAAAGAGVLGIIIGAPLLAINGNYTNCDDRPLDDKYRCKDIHDTAAGGVVLTGAGIMALTASGVLLYLHYRPEIVEGLGLQGISLLPITDRSMAFGVRGFF